jgi:2-polyprenyl-3-methyl-5-hydroxy-6-metoxy-1,4-benzoquinol methylase
MRALNRKSDISYSTFPHDPPSLGTDWYRFYRCLYWLQRSTPGKISRADKWLDIGCHSGALLRAVMTTIGCQCSGCDVYPAKHKEDRLYECFQLTDNSSWNYKEIDVARGLDWPGVKFTVISALEVIEHIIDTDRFLNEVHTHLEEGGLFLITTPNINSLRNRLGVPFGQYPIGLEYRNVIHHVRLYNTTAIEHHLESHGFDVIGIWGVQMLPRRWILRSTLIRGISEFFADLFPQLASNIIVIGQKRIQS